MFNFKHIIYLLILHWCYLDNAIECSVIPTLADFSAENDFDMEPFELNDDNIRVGRQVNYVYGDTSCEDDNIDTLQSIYLPQSQMSINQQQTQINNNGQQQQQQIYVSQNQQNSGPQVFPTQISPSITDLIIRTRILFALLNSIPAQNSVSNNCQSSVYQNNDLGEVIFRFPIRRTTPNPHCYASTLLQNPELLGLWQQIIKICGGNPQLLSIVLEGVIKSGYQGGLLGGLGQLLGGSKDGGLLGGLGGLLVGGQSGGGLLGGLGGLLGGSQSSSGGLLGGLGGLLGGSGQSGSEGGLLGGLGGLLGGSDQTGQQGGLLGGLGQLLGGQGGNTGDKGTVMLPGLNPVSIGSNGGLLGGLESLVNGPVKDGSNGLLGGLGGILGGPRGMSKEGGLLGGLDSLLVGSPYGLNYPNAGVLGDLGGLLGGSGGTVGGLEKLLTGNKGANGGVLGDLGGILGGNGYIASPASDSLGSSENRRGGLLGSVPIVGGLLNGLLSPVTGLLGLGSRRHINNENHVSIEGPDGQNTESNSGLINHLNLLGIEPKINVRRELEPESLRSGSSDTNTIQKEENEWKRHENIHTDNQEEVRQKLVQTENIPQQQIRLENMYSKEITNNAVQENDFRDEDILHELEKSKNNKRKYRRRKYKVVEPINVNEMEKQETQIQKSADDLDFNIPMNLKKYYQMKQRQCMHENMGNAPSSKENVDKYYASISSEY